MVASSPSRNASPVYVSTGPRIAVTALPASPPAISVSRGAGQPHDRHALLPGFRVPRGQQADLAVLEETPFWWIHPITHGLGPKAALRITRFAFDVAELRISHVAAIRPAVPLTQHDLVEVAALVSRHQPDDGNEAIESVLRDDLELDFRIHGQHGLQGSG